MDIIEKKKDKSYGILKKNKDNLLSLNSNIIIETIIIEAETEQYLKQIYQKNKISKTLLKEKPGTTISEIKE